MNIFDKYNFDEYDSDEYDSDDSDRYNFNDNFHYDKHFRNLIANKEHKPKEQSTIFFNLDEKLEKIKIRGINSSTLEYPTLILSLYYKSKSMITDVNCNFIFGASLGNNLGIKKLPFFACNISLDNIESFLGKVSDEIMLESIKLLNSIYKKKDITTLDQVKKFKSYISSRRFFKNITFDFYFNCLKKLMFFFEKLFTEVLKQKFKKSSPSPIEGNNYDDLMEIDKYTRKNIKIVREILFYDSSDKYEITDISCVKDNLYQIVNGVINLDQNTVVNNKINDKIYLKYKTDYNNSLKKYKDFIRGNKDSGNFYIVIKKDYLFGSFNSFIECKLVDKKTLPQSGLLSLNCSLREKTIMDIFSMIKGGKTRKVKSKTIKRKRKY